MGNWETVGEVTVDTGHIVIVDPVGVNDTGTTLDAMEMDGWPRVKAIAPDNCRCGGKYEHGAIIESGYGDGIYPIEARFTRDGRVAEVRIIFIEEDA